MTTHSDIREKQRLDQLEDNRRLMGRGLLWADILLVILTVWLLVKYPEQGFLLLVALVALDVAVLAGAAWQLLLRPWPANASVPEMAAAVLKQRRLLGYGMIGGAVILLGLGLWLSAGHGLDAFPEVSGMVVLALIAIGTGISQLRAPEPGPVERREVMQWLLARRQLVIGALLGAAAVCAGLAIWAFFTAGPGPDLIGAGVLTMLFLGVGLWQALLSPEEASPQTMRLLVLVTGGLFGFIVAVITVWRVWRWWGQGEIFYPDVPTAESPGLWRLWLGAYVEMLGLAILFGSLLLGRADIRQSPAMRRVLFGYNTVLTGLLLLATLVLLNVVVYVTYPFTAEWTASLGMHSLSPSTKNLLQGLRQPVRVYAVLSQGGPAYKEVRILLENAQAYTRMLQVDYVSPDREAARYQRLAKEFPSILREERGMLRNEEEEVGRGVLLVYGAEGAEKPPHAWIPTRDLADSKLDKGGKRTVLFKGEDVIMTQLKLLAQQEIKPKIYFTQGNDELDLTDALKQFQTAVDRRGGAGLLLERLKKDNYEVRGLVWGPPPAVKKGTQLNDLMVFAKKKPEDREEVPEDAKVVVIAHPLSPFSKEVRAALERYMDRGGKMIVLTNLLIRPDLQPLDTHLSELLQKYNVKLGDDFLLRYPENANDNPFLMVATPPETSRNKIVENFRTSRFPVGGGFFGRYLGWVRSVRSAGAQGAYQVEPLLEVGPRRNGMFWAETDMNVLRSPIVYLRNLAADDKLDAKKSAEPIPVAVAVSDRDGKPRLAVFGDARFASNLYVQGPAPYYDFLTSTIEWLAERPENMGIKPRESTTYNLQPEQVNRPRLIWLPLGLVLLFFLGLGMGIWVVRRR